ncbi:MAG: lipoyl(octanoyl) transferase LipB [Burkholderiales bacterium]|uniref:lipoyl(octanoyl) transferase LipB n=1 Tax=Roseateles sp. TaxID=1971397 RepID=UPI000FA70DBE|nr:MAG: lipoyl(octanoyl) transferase LipB [Burkholderiales bacterium]
MIVKTLGRVEYLPTLEAMRAFTAARGADTPDELWLCEHPPTFTQGLAGKPEHLLGPGDIPVVPTERGGQVTYHGPGQITAYPLVDLRRLGIYVKEYVFRLETALIQTLDSYGVTGLRVAGAPGIYVRPADPGSHAALAGPADPTDAFKGLAKIAALGIKVSRHCTYHGLALNVAMDLEPFGRINPCGYEGLETTALDKIGVFTDWSTAAGRLAERLVAQLTP